MILCSVLQTVLLFRTNPSHLCNFVLLFLQHYYTVGVHNTEYEVMSEDPSNNSSNSPNTLHTLVRASHSNSFYHNASNSTSNGNMSISSSSFSNFNGVPVGVRASSAKHGTGALFQAYW